jgi:hypothetical protein
VDDRPTDIAALLRWGCPDESADCHRERDQAADEIEKLRTDLRYAEEELVAHRAGLMSRLDTLAVREAQDEIQKWRARAEAASQRVAEKEAIITRLRSAPQDVVNSLTYMTADAGEVVGYIEERMAVVMGENDE